MHYVEIAYPVCQVRPSDMHGTVGDLPLLAETRASIRDAAEPRACLTDSEIDSKSRADPLSCARGPALAAFKQRRRA
jgi:hypothetical protein